MYKDNVPLTFFWLTVVSTLFFDEEKDRSGMERNKMLITFNYQITLMEMKTENRDKIMSHEKPVTAAIYNSVYNQVRPIWQFSYYCKYTYIF